MARKNLFLTCFVTIKTNIIGINTQINYIILSETLQKQNMKSVKLLKLLTSIQVFLGKYYKMGIWQCNIYSFTLRIYQILTFAQSFACGS